MIKEVRESKVLRETEGCQEKQMKKGRMVLMEFLENREPLDNQEAKERWVKEEKQEVQGQKDL